MTYDEHLAGRIRAILDNQEGVTEKRMFGGVAFLLDGKMSVAASGRGGLMVRVPPERMQELMAVPHAGPFEMRGKPVDGWMRVHEDGVDREADLRRWVQIGVERAKSLG